MGLFQTLSRLTQPRAGVAVPSEPLPGVGEVLQHLDAQVVDGRRLEALRTALPHARRLRSAELWGRIATLRMEAVDEVAATVTPNADWPPRLDDPFPGSGLPEIQASELTARALGGAILHHGSLIVRNLLDAASAEQLRLGIDTALDASAAYHADTSAPPKDPVYVPFPLAPGSVLAHARGFTQSDGAVWAAEAPELLEGVLDLYRRRGVIEAICGYLGEPPLLSVGKTVLRRAEPTGRNGEFHQDGAFMGADIRTVNVWVALSDCGDMAPGLELVPRRLQGLAERGVDTYFDWSVGRGTAEAAAGEAGLVRPLFKCGDAILFDQLMLHATYGTPAMDRRRYAIESWFFAPSSYPADQVAIAI